VGKKEKRAEGMIEYKLRSKCTDMMRKKKTLFRKEEVLE
jgi:hypothetical protein